MPEISEGRKHLVVVLSAPGLYCLKTLPGPRLKCGRGAGLGQSCIKLRVEGFPESGRGQAVPAPGEELGAQTVEVL
jgi:hypothetical protein